MSFIMLNYTIFEYMCWVLIVNGKSKGNEWNKKKKTKEKIWKGNRITFINFGEKLSFEDIQLQTQT